MMRRVSRLTSKPSDKPFTVGIGREIEPCSTLAASGRNKRVSAPLCARKCASMNCAISAPVAERLPAGVGLQISKYQGASVAES